MKTSTPEFLQKLRKFVQDEAEAQYRQLEQQWSHALQERVARGWAIEGLRVEQMKNGIARLTCSTNDSRFREGDLVLLHRDNPWDTDALHFDLQYDGETDLEVISSPARSQSNMAGKEDYSPNSSASNANSAGTPPVCKKITGSFLPNRPFSISPSIPAKALAV